MANRIRSLFEASGIGNADSLRPMSRCPSTTSPTDFQQQQPATVLWFSCATLEDLFVVSLMQKDTMMIRVIATVGLALAVLASMFQPLDHTTYLLFAVNVGVWFAASVMLALLLAHEHLLRLLSSCCSLRFFLSSSSSPLTGTSSSLLLAIRPSPVTQARVSEVITVLGLFGGNIVYTMANIVSGLTCHSNVDTTTTRCLDGDGYETNGMFTFLILCIVAPARTFYVVMCVLAHLAATIGTFLWVSKVPTSKLYEAALLLTSQLAVCVVVVYVREVQQRKTFLLRRQQGEAVRRMEMVRRLAVETAAQRMPPVVVCSLSNSGAYSSRGDAIVVGFRLANFGCWSSLKGPHEVVRAVMGLLEACEVSMAPLFDNTSLITLPLTKLGDNVTFVFFPHGGATTTTAATLDACVPTVVSSTLVAMQTIEMICKEVLNQQEASSRREQRHQEDSRLHPMAVVAAGGDVHVWFASAFGNLMASGPPVDEAATALQHLANTHQCEPRLHLSKFVASRCNRGGDVSAQSVRDNEIPLVDGGVEEPRSSEQRPDEAKQFMLTLENKFQLEGLFQQRFSDSVTESAFADHRRSHSMDLHTVVFHAVSMFVMGVATLGVCFLYHQHSWSARSPLPYSVSCCMSAVILFAYCTTCHSQYHHRRRRVFVLDTCYWLFCFGCLAASIMPPQDSSVFGGSIFPWCLIAGTVSFQRPLWYGPLTMWSLELCISLTVLLWVFLPIRTVSPFTASVALRMTIPAGVVGLVVRLLMDRQARSHYKWQAMLPEVHNELVRETNHLIHFLDNFMPSRVAERIIAHRLSASSSQELDSAISRRGKRRFFGNVKEPIRLMTSVEDQAFGLIQWRSSPDADGGGLPSVGMASRFSSTAPSQPLVDMVAGALKEFHHGAESSSSPSFRSASSIGRVTVVKADGDIVMLASDAAICGDVGCVHASENLGSGCSAMAMAVRRLHTVLQEKGVDIRSVVGACPMIGAVVGGTLHAPSFEWLASELHAALRMLQMSDEMGPICWGHVVCTMRARYHMMMMTTGNENDEDASSCFVDVKIAGSPRQRVSVLM